MRRYDAVVVGSGINSLVAGGLLAKEGWTVCVLERNDWLGGAIRTAEITEPGFVHEVFASWHPLFTGSAAYMELRGELRARGVEYLNTELPTATLFPDGESRFLTTSHQENVASLGPGWEPDRVRVHAKRRPHLRRPRHRAVVARRARARLQDVRRLGRRGLVEFAGNVLSTCRDWTADTFQDERAGGSSRLGCCTPGSGPDAASSGFMAQVIGVAIELGGMPVPRGGGVRLVEALAGIVRDAGGACETGREVEQFVVESDRATGVRRPTARV